MAGEAAFALQVQPRSRNVKCKVCNGTRECVRNGVSGEPCGFCDERGRPLHWCSACDEPLPLCACFGRHRVLR